MKKYTLKAKLSIAVLTSAGLLSSCSLVQTPATDENNNLKKASPVVVAGSEGLGAKLTAAGGCDRGVFVIDVMNNTSGYGDPQAAYYASGKGYFTKKSWAHKKVNPFHLLGFEKGEATFPKGEKPETPYLADKARVMASFYTGVAPAPNMIAEDSAQAQVEALDLEPIPSGDGAKTYQLKLNKGKDRYSNYYLGNIPSKEEDILGIGDRGAPQGKANTSAGPGVGVFTHFSFGKEGFGEGVYSVPSDIEDPKASFSNVFEVSVGDPLKLTIAPRTKELSANTKAAHIIVRMFSENMKDKLNPMSFNVEDKGQTEIEIPTAGLSEGQYRLVAMRSELHTSPVLDEEGGNFCVLAGAAANSLVEVAAKK